MVEKIKKKRISVRIARYLKLASKAALLSEHDTFRHGAILVKGGAIISTACNKDQYNRFGARFRNKICGHATHHAELGAILGIDKKVSAGATMYVVRINREGEFRLSKPCAMCSEVMKFCGIKKVIYTTNSNSIENLRL